MNELLNINVPNKNYFNCEINHTLGITLGINTAKFVKWLHSQTTALFVSLTVVLQPSLAHEPLNELNERT